MVGGVESQYSPITWDVIDPPSYIVNSSQLKQLYTYSYSFCNGKNIKHLTNYRIQNEENLSAPVGRSGLESAMSSQGGGHIFQEIQAM